MAREERHWHPRFEKYMDFIINHPNYKGLPIKKKNSGEYAWIATAKSETGKARIKWCEQKARQLNIPVKPGVFAKVMLEIHPTKMKVCQTCGEEMSLYYHYPSINLIKSIEKEFGVEYSIEDHIEDIWGDLINHGFDNNKIARFLLRKINIVENPIKFSKMKVIELVENECRNNGKRLLSPGAMSNFPDRYDGFHTYNRCCRSAQDKGRSKENLRSYTKDRRAYEYWSDGNIHAANQFMGSVFFEGVSADHIGPISLGFVHDSNFLQPMGRGDNSSKRDRLELSDIEQMIEIEKRTNMSSMSWYSQLIWEHIKTNYLTNRHLISSTYRDMLKQNMSNFMYILWNILDSCGDIGENFLEEALLKPKYNYFNHSYEFNDYGEIIRETPRNFTERSLYEDDRYRRIAFKSVYDYNNKANRHLEPDLSKDEMEDLNKLCIDIMTDFPVEQTKLGLERLMHKIQSRIIESF